MTLWSEQELDGQTNIFKYSFVFTFKHSKMSVIWPKNNRKCGFAFEMQPEQRDAGLGAGPFRCPSGLTMCCHWPQSDRTDHSYNWSASFLSPVALRMHRAWWLAVFDLNLLKGHAIWYITVHLWVVHLNVPHLKVPQKFKDYLHSSKLLVQFWVIMSTASDGATFFCSL